MTKHWQKCGGDIAEVTSGGYGKAKWWGGGVSGELEVGG